MNYSELEATLETVSIEVRRIERLQDPWSAEVSDWMTTYKTHVKALLDFRETLIWFRNQCPEGERGDAEVPNSGALPVFRAGADIYAHYKIPAPPTPLPATVLIQRNKRWKVSREIRGHSWGRTTERALLAYLRETRTEACKEYVRSYRKLRREAVSKTTLSIERGPVNFRDTSANSLRFSTTALLRQLYYQARQAISHKRRTSRSIGRDEGKFGDRVGLVYTRPGAVLRRQGAKRKEGIFSAKAPKSRVPHVGLELEFTAALRRSGISDALYAEGLLPYAHLKEDGSLRPTEPGDETHELCLLLPEKALGDVVAKACSALKKAGGKVNSTCGLHVHLDMRNRRPEVCFQRLMASLNLLYSIVPRERWYNSYCRRNPSTMTWRTALTGQRGERAERYLAINPLAWQEHRTIEVRLHAGTLNAEAISNWAELLLFIIRTPNTVQYRDPERYIEALNLPARLADYVRSRVAIYSGETGDTEVGQLPVYTSHAQRGTCMCGSCLTLDDPYQNDYQPPTEAAIEDED